MTPQPERTQAQAKALDQVARASRTYEALAEKASNAKAARDAAVYDAREQHGASYADLATALGLTRDRVNQLLKEARAKRA